MTLEICPSKREDCYELAPRLRALDAKEVMLSGGFTPLGALQASFLLSDVAWTGRIDGRVEAMFGVSPHNIDGEIGVPWFLASDEVRQVRVAMIREARLYVELMETLYGKLVQCVYHEQVEMVDWLKALGFERIGEVPDYGVGKALFYVYSKNV